MHASYAIPHHCRHMHAQGPRGRGRRGRHGPPHGGFPGFLGRGPRAARGDVRAGILALLGIMCSLASTKLRLVAGAVAGVSAVAAYSAPMKLNIVLAIAAAVLVCLGLEPRRPRTATSGEA